VKRKILIVALAIALIVPSLFWGVPAFAQTHVATWIPGQPLSTIAARQIITDSGLPAEKLPDGTVNSLTRGRDIVNAYRYAHEQLSKKGWYRGISQDHTPLLQAMIEALIGEGYTTKYSSLQYQAEEVLRKFFAANDEQRAKELGYASYDLLSRQIYDYGQDGNTQAKKQLLERLDAKWH
jgi:hypothetical protein